jgi:hypothetical protein
VGGSASWTADPPAAATNIDSEPSCTTTLEYAGDVPVGVSAVFPAPPAEFASVICVPDDEPVLKSFWNGRAISP